MPCKQGRVWIGTVPLASWLSLGPPEDLCGKNVTLAYVKGQHEVGDGGYEHCQVIAHFGAKVTLAQCKVVFGGFGHWELTRSAAAENYVWKDESAVSGTRFECGSKPMQRSSKKDWDAIWESAKSGKLGEIPASVRVSSYRTLRAIATDHMEALAMERTNNCFWGITGSGKSRDAWAAAGPLAYSKDPRSEFWDGYRGQENVVIDEFRGGFHISQLLRVLDRYPVILQVKGSSVPSSIRRVWITSNLHPRDWYPVLDVSTYDALKRRLIITQYFRDLPPSVE